MNDPTPRGAEEPQDLEQVILHQDGYRKCMCGGVADPRLSPHPGGPESTDDELTHAAMEDPAAVQLQVAHPQPTLWRLVALLVLAVVALTVVFWRFR